MLIISKSRFKYSLLLSSCALATLLPSIVYAAEFAGDKSAVIVSQLPANSLYIRVSGPGNYTYETTDNILHPTTNRLLLDGQYSYEVTATVDEPLPDTNQAVLRENGRDAGIQRQMPSEVVENGHFRMLDGVVVTTANKETEQ
ncbi:hypothetical protein N9936_02130 [bacterium]|nr:hypothetical protein [bacterium]